MTKQLIVIVLAAAAALETAPAVAAAPNYQLIRTVGSGGSANGQFDAPHLAVNSAGDVWVADEYNDRIQEFDPRGNWLQTIGTLGGSGLWWPQGLAVDSSGDVWVADSGNSRVVKCDANGNYLRQFGNGVIDDAESVAVDTSGNVWVADWWNYRVDKFTGSGSLIQDFGPNGSGGPASTFSWLGGLATDSAGDVWVADHSGVYEFDTNGNFLRTITSAVGGSLSWPGDVAVDSQNNVWIADSNNDRVVEFNNNGVYLNQFATAGSPGSIAVDAAGDVWVGDFTNNRLLEYSAVPEPATFVLLGIGGLSVLGFAWRRRARTA
jgi:streptogramin lyase